MSNYGIPPVSVRPGEWLRVPYSGYHLARVEMKVGKADWATCYHDDGDVMIRMPNLPSGDYVVKVRTETADESTLGSVKVPGVSVRITKN